MSVYRPRMRYTHATERWVCHNTLAYAEGLTMESAYWRWHDAASEAARNLIQWTYGAVRR